MCLKCDYGMKIITKRLILRPINLDDKKEIFYYRSNTEINKFQGWIPEKIEDVELFINKVSKQINEPQTWFQFVITLKETHKIIGDIGIHFFDKENMQVEIGCTLSQKYQNSGYATESLTGVIDFLFGELKKHRIITSIDPENDKSIKLVERIGFRKEAHFVSSLFLNGRWVDDMIYALIEKDWNN